MYAWVVRASDKLNRLITERRLSRADIAEKAGISYSTFRSYLEGERARIPSADKGVRIAALLGVGAEWLWDDALDWPPPNPPRASSERLSDQELLDELHRRQDAIRRDIDRLADSLTSEAVSAATLATIARLMHGEASYHALPPAEQTACFAVFFNMERLVHLLDQLRFFGVDAQPPQKLIEAIARNDGLRSAWEGALQRPNHAYWTRLRSGRIDDASAALPPALIEKIGAIASVQQFESMQTFEQKCYVPVLDDLANGPPRERIAFIYRGQKAPPNVREFVRFDSSDATTFAVRLREVDAGDRPAGTLIVCLGTPATQESGRRLKLIAWNGGRDYAVAAVEDGKVVSPAKLAKLAGGARDAIATYPIVAEFPP